MKKSEAKVKIVKITFIMAEDENGETYSLDNYPFNTKSKEVVYEQVNGVISSEYRQDKYSDGTYARSETLHTSFKITDEL